MKSLYCFLLVVGLSLPAIGAAVNLSSNPQVQHPLVAGNIRVPITLGIMSRCPDAKLCENILDTAFEQVGFDKVDVSLFFVARLNESDPDFGVTCRHGVQECRGNIHQLCVTKYLPITRDWWPWLECVNLDGDVGSLGRARQCAEVSGFDWNRSGVGNCVDNGEGTQLLKQSIQNSDSLGITKSCTIMISGKLRCIHDGDWEQCEGGHSVADFVRSIKEEYARLNNS